MVRFLSGVVVIYLVVALVLLAIATGIGFLLHWLIAEVDLGMAILIGLVVTGMTIHFQARLAGYLRSLVEPEDEESAGPTPPVVIVSPPPPPSRGKRRRG